MSLFNPTPEELNPDNFKYEEFFSKYGDEIWDNGDVKHNYKPEEPTREEIEKFSRTQPSQDPDDRFNDDIGYENTEHGFYWFFNNPRTPRYGNPPLEDPEEGYYPQTPENILFLKGCRRIGITEYTDHIHCSFEDGYLIIREDKSPIVKGSVLLEHDKHISKTLGIMYRMWKGGYLDKEKLSNLNLGRNINQVTKKLSSKEFVNQFKSLTGLLKIGVKLSYNGCGFEPDKNKKTKTKRFVNKLLQKNLRK